MEAIRQFIKVKNRQINIVLPDDFNSDEVEVIILPSSQENETPQWHIDEVRKRTSEYLKNPEMALDFDKVIREIENEL
jgi:hypothetical protein